MSNQEVFILAYFWVDRDKVVGWEPEVCFHGGAADGERLEEGTVVNVVVVGVAGYWCDIVSEVMREFSEKCKRVVRRVP